MTAPRVIPDPEPASSLFMVGVGFLVAANTAAALVLAAVYRFERRLRRTGR